MAKQIIWSPLSETDLEHIFDYLLKNWTQQVAINFLDNIDNLISKIAKNPKLFPFVNKKRKIRKCVVTKHNSIFYRENKTLIEILRIFDTRQNPQKKKL
jgi:plasmid stabilization system protein ParE